MKTVYVLIACGCLLIASFAYGLQVFTPVGTTSVIQQSTGPVLVGPTGAVSMRLIAPNVYAEDDPAIGATAYTNCMLTVGASDMVCSITRNTAWANDALKRWNTAFNTLMNFKSGNGPTTDQILASQKLHWIPTN